MIKPEIGKLPKSVVERIPLVIYIPPPPDEPAKDPAGINLSVPDGAYTYPPKPPAPAHPKRRFAFLKNIHLKGKGKGGANRGSGEDGGKGGKERGDAKGGSEPESRTWEQHWEQGEYPFVRLEGNRAACAICLMDFEEPRRLIGAEATEAKAHGEGNTDGEKASGEEHANVGGQVQEVSGGIVTEDRDVQLRLADAGEGVQPLRLLACGHVFHVRFTFSPLGHSLQLALIVTDVVLYACRTENVP